MKLVIISDLHLGIKGDISNDFKLNEQQFYNYLQYVIDKYDLLVLNGDVFELWEDMFETKGITIEEKMKIRVDNIINSWVFGNLIRTHPKIIIINGNHDLYLKKYNILPKRIHDKLIITHNGYNILITHGHKGDILCSDNSCFSRIICCCSQTKSSFEHLLDEKLDDVVSKIVDSIDTDEQKITNYAIGLLNTSHMNLVVLGHTHNKCSIRHNYKLYVNEGCVVGKNDSIDECDIHIYDNKMIVNVVNKNINNLNFINKITQHIFVDGKLS